MLLTIYVALTFLWAIFAVLYSKRVNNEGTTTSRQHLIIFMTYLLTFPMSALVAFYCRCRGRNVFLNRS